MRLFQRGQVARTSVDFDTHQQHLEKLSGEMLSHYRKELDAEISSPDRLQAVYGIEFASAGLRAQAHNIATLAASILAAPNAMVNVIIGDTQTTIAAVGAAADVAPVHRNESFCQHVIGTGREFAVDESGRHALVCNTKFARDGDIISYLGVPIVSQDQIVGVLCVYDDKPREWSVTDVGMLTQLAAVLTRAISA